MAGPGLAGRVGVGRSATVERYPPELRERMVAEVQHEYPSEWAAVESVAAKLGIGTAQALLNWIRRAQTEDGERPGVTTEMRKLRAENRELKRAYEILSTPRPPRGRCDRDDYPTQRLWHWLLNAAGVGSSYDSRSLVLSADQVPRLYVYRSDLLICLD